MNNLGVLYRYELKKILMRKIVYATLTICFIATAILLIGELIGPYYIGNEKVDTQYHMFLTDRNYQKMLDGKEIDQALLEETIAAYGRIPITAEKYSSTEEYQKYARPYSAIFNFVRDTTHMTLSEMLQWTPDLDDLYAQRQSMLENQWISENLSEGEKAFWRQKEAGIKTPFVYQITDSYYMLFRAVTTIGLLVLMAVSICLSGLFAEEHTKRTDQLILCSKHGKGMAYWAKILAGISFAGGISLLLSIFAALVSVGIYGTDGFDAMFQLIFAEYSYPLTVCQAVLILYGCVIVTSVIFSTFVMLLSEILHSNIATLAVTFGMLILSMICSIPSQYRVLAQIWDWLPSGFLTPWNIFDIRLVSAFGHYLTAWQAVPVIYIFASMVIAAVGKPIYRHFQVTGR